MFSQVFGEFMFSQVFGEYATSSTEKQGNLAHICVISLERKVSVVEYLF